MLQIFRHVKEFIRKIVLAMILLVFSCLYYISYIRLKYKSKPSPNNKASNATSFIRNNGKVAIIIAVKNEAKVIGKTIRNLESTTVDKSRCEIILVDAGCTDNTVDVAKASSCCIPIRIVKQKISYPGRGSALNAGFDQSTSDIVMFLRSDSLVPPGYDETLRREHSNSSTLLTAFKFKVDPDGVNNLIEPSGLKIIEIQVNFRSSFCCLPAGHQALAMRSVVYSENRYHNGEFLEDIELVSRIRELSLKGLGEIKVLDQKVLTSANRYIAVGIVKGILVEQFPIILFGFFGVRTENYFEWCYVTLPKLLRWMPI